MLSEVLNNDITKCNLIKQINEIKTSNSALCMYITWSSTYCITFHIVSSTTLAILWCVISTRCVLFHFLIQTHPSVLFSWCPRSWKVPLMTWSIKCRGNLLLKFHSCVSYVCSLNWKLLVSILGTRIVGCMIWKSNLRYLKVSIAMLSLSVHVIILVSMLVPTLKSLLVEWVQCTNTTSWKFLKE